MKLELAKRAIDLGIVVRDPAASLRFYQDALGLELVAHDPMPFGGTMYRLMCGDSMIKLVHLDADPPMPAPPGGIAGGYGYRYWTIAVDNIEAVTDGLAAAGYRVAVPVRTIREGVSISMIEDPDGNWVELICTR